MNEIYEAILKPITDKNNAKCHVFHRAIAEYGRSAQMDMAIEEMAELTQAICKNKRGADNRENIIEEIADVTIMLIQLKMIFSICDDEIETAAINKIDRLEERMKTEHADKLKELGD